MSVCVYMYVYIYMHIGMYVCTHACAGASMHDICKEGEKQTHDGSTEDKHSNHKASDSFQSTREKHHTIVAVIMMVILPIDTILVLRLNLDRDGNEM